MEACRLPAIILPVPLDEFPQADFGRRGGMEPDIGGQVLHIGVGRHDVAGLHRQIFDDGFFVEMFFEDANEPFQPTGFSLPML